MLFLVQSYRGNRKDVMAATEVNGGPASECPGGVVAICVDAGYPMRGRWGAEEGAMAG
jgi:hypothetical protein